VGAAIRGIQSNHIISTIKHFALNGQETGRKFVDIQIAKAPRAKAICWRSRSASRRASPARSCAPTTA
jgi:hypothetical protein